MSRRSEDPEEDCEVFERGASKGSCWGDGHYECMNCKHLRADFKEGGWKYVNDMWARGSLSALHVISLDEKGKVATIKGW